MSEKIKIKFVSKAIQELRKEFEEKIKKVKEKENATIERPHKEFSMAILELYMNDDKFKSEFNNLITKYQSDKLNHAHKKLIEIYA